MAILVYQLTCTVSGKSYVGITSRALDTRWLEHCARARQGLRLGSRLYDALRKYGLDAFTREVIATVDTDDEARSAEKAFILQLGTYANGYNANEGGHGWLTMPEAAKRKSSATQKGRVISPETRGRMSAAKAGKPECADHLGINTSKGAANPRAKAYLIRFPDGSERVITGLLAFCRKTGARNQVLRKGYCSRGYTIVHHVKSNDAIAVSALTEERVA